jgi:hypothetical protein
MHVAVLVTIGLLTLVIGAPIFLSIMAGTIITFEAYGPPIPSMVIPQRMVDGVNKFSLLAIPLFIFAADIISRGQIGSRLVRLAESFVGHITGGLAIATVLACALFGAMSGIGPAAVVSIGPLSLSGAGQTRLFSRFRSRSDHHCIHTRDAHSAGGRDDPLCLADELVDWSNLSCRTYGGEHLHQRSVLLCLCVCAHARHQTDRQAELD